MRKKQEEKMAWAILNFLFSVFEMTVTWGLIWCFMNINSKTLYRRKGWYIVGALLAGGTEYLYAVFNPNSWGSVILQIVLSLIGGAALFHKEWLALILDLVFETMLFLGMECGIFISNVIVAQVGIEWFPYPACIGCMAMALKIILMLILSVPMIRWRKSNSESPLTLRQTFTVLVLPVFSLFFLYSFLEVSSLYYQIQGLWLILANIVALVLLNVYFLYLFRYLFKANKLEQEMHMAEVKNEVQYRYYEELERKYRESRKILHDMKNHLAAVEQLYQEQKEEAGGKYVQDLYHMINVLGEKYYSSNHMLNIILNEKLSLAQSLGIQVKAQVGDVKFADMKDMDITIIFGNLLDNAVEACRDCGKEAFLELKIDRVQDFRVVQIRNSRNATVREKSATGKKQHMGLGIPNVKQTLEKYHGTLEFTMTDKEYRVNIMISGVM